MGHNLNTNITTGKVAFATAVEPAWHKLGTMVDKKMTTEEAIVFGGLDFEVAKQPHYVRITVQEPLYDANGNVKVEGKYEFIESPRSYGTVRMDTHEVLGTVGEKYAELQNRDAFLFFDHLIDEGEGYIETVGALGKGERIFICAKMPQHISVLGKEDLIEQYILITTSHDGNTQTRAMFTPIRVVCQNTLNAALSAKTPNHVKVKHTGGQIEAIKMAHKVLGLNNNYRNELSEIFSRLADKKADEEMYERIIVSGMADEPNMVKKYFDSKAKQSTRFRRRISEVMEYAFTHPTQLTPATDGTLFGAYNAVTGFYQNEIDWEGEEDKKMQDIIDFNGRVFLKQQQAFEKALAELNITVSAPVEEEVTA